MTLEEKRTLLFAPLRPLCSLLAVNPCSQLLDRLDVQVKKFDPAELQLLEEHVLYPMQVYLKTLAAMPENYTIEVLKFVARFYSRVNVTSAFVFADLLTSILSMTTLASTTSEDAKMAVCDCVTSLVKGVRDGDRNDVIFTSGLEPKIGHLVFQTLDWAEKEEESNRVVVCALATVRSLCPDDDDDRFFRQFSKMLPGITTKVAKTLLNRRRKSCHKVVVEALRTWTAFVCRCLLKDPLLPDDWLDKAQGHLLQHLQTFHKSFTRHEKLAVRWEMHRLCRRLLSDCVTTMRPARSLLIESLATLSVDLECRELAECSKRCLDQVVVTARHDDDDDLEEMVRQVHEKIFVASTELSDCPSVLLNERELATKLWNLHGFLLLLRNVEASSLFFYSDTYVGRLLDGLLAVTCLETNILVGSNFLHDFSNFNFVFHPELQLKLTRHEKAFKYLTTADLRRRVASITGLVAASSSLALLSDHLLSKFQQAQRDEQSVLELVFLLNNVIAESSGGGGDAADKKVLYELVENFVQIYLNCFARVVPTTTLATPDDLEGGRSTDNWSEECLIVEGLGTMALAAGNLGFSSEFVSDHLPSILVFVLSRTDLADSHSAHVLHFALVDLAEGCGFSSVLEMLKDNLDHICLELAVMLRSCFSSAGRRNRRRHSLHLPTLLKAVLRLSNVKESDLSDVPELRDVIDSLLAQLNLSWIDPDAETTTEILRVIDIFVESFVDYDDDDGPEEKKRERSTGCDDDGGSVTRLLKDLKESYEMDQKILTNDEWSPSCPSGGFHSANLVVNEDHRHDDDDDDDDVEEDEELLLPEKIKFLRRTVQHTRHFISMVGRPRWQLLSLGIVCNCMLLVRMKRNEMLPLVHQSWKPLKLLFESDNVFVVAKAFRALLVFGRCARDFIRQRALSDVFPPLAKFVGKLQMMVKDRDMHQTMAARQSRRLLAEMVHGMWELMALLDLDELESDKVIDMAIDFVDFSRNELHGPEQVCRFLPMRDVDADILWLKCWSKADVNISC